jgi:hypothetical protein
VTAPGVLARRASPDPRAVWEARVSADRGRLEVVLVVQPRATVVTVPILSQGELRQLLEAAPREEGEGWICLDCRHGNAAGRRWCERCSLAITA